MGSTGELSKMYFFLLKSGRVHVLLANPWFPNGFQRQTSFISQKKIKIHNKNESIVALNPLLLEELILPKHWKHSFLRTDFEKLYLLIYV